MILPDPGKDFGWRKTPYGPALVCGPLEGIAPHLFTTSAWGLGRAPGAGPAAWAEIAAALGCDPAHMGRARQVHGRAVVRADAVRSATPGVHGARGRADGPIQERRLPDGDILVGHEAGFAVAVQVADCVPLLIADPRSGAVAAAHAGWRGLSLGVPRAAVAALADAWGARPGDLVAAIGPSVGACCYEVGPDVRADFATRGAPDTALDEWFLPRPAALQGNPRIPAVPQHGRPDRWYFDGWRAARDQLLEAGLLARHVFGAELCTASHAGVFCSFRRDGAAAGRMAAAITPSRRP